MAGAMVGAAAWVDMRSPEAAQSMRSNIRPRGAHYLAPAASRQARQSTLPRQLLQHFYPSMETEGVTPPPTAQPVSSTETRDAGGSSDGSVSRDEVRRIIREEVSAALAGALGHLPPSTVPGKLPNSGIRGGGGGGGAGGHRAMIFLSHLHLSHLGVQAVAIACVGARLAHTVRVHV